MGTVLVDVNKTQHPITLYAWTRVHNSDVYCRTLIMFTADPVNPLTAGVAFIRVFIFLLAH